MSTTATYTKINGLTEDEQTRRKVRLTNVHHGRPLSNNGKGALFIYAELADAETGEGLVMATLSYIMESVKNHNFILVA